MGFFKGIGKAALNTVKGVGYVGMGAGYAAGQTSKFVGKAIQGAAAPVILGVGAGALTLGALSDHDNTGFKEGAKTGAFWAGTATLAGIGAGAAVGAAGKLAGVGTITGGASVGAAIGSSIPTVIGAGAVSAAATGVGMVGALGSKMVNVPKDWTFLGQMGDGPRLKPTGVGIAAVIAGATFKGASKLVETAERTRMGVNDGMMTRATPRMPSYQNNGGASGDLVFALHNQR